MLIAKIKWRDDGIWYCSECKMKQPGLRETCIFCGSLFTNFEDELMRASVYAEDASAKTAYPESFTKMGRRIVK